MIDAREIPPTSLTYWAHFILWLLQQASSSTITTKTMHTFVLRVGLSLYYLNIATFFSLNSLYIFSVLARHLLISRSRRNWGHMMSLQSPKQWILNFVTNDRGIYFVVGTDIQCPNKNKKCHAMYHLNYSVLHNKRNYYIKICFLASSMLTWDDLWSFSSSCSNVPEFF